MSARYAVEIVQKGENHFVFVSCLSGGLLSVILLLTTSLWWIHTGLRVNVTLEAHEK